MKNAEVREATEFSQLIAAALKKRLREAGVAQGDVATELGVSRSKVTERLNGLRALDTDIIDVSAQLLGTSPKSLVESILDDIGKARGE